MQKISASKFKPRSRKPYLPKVVKREIVQKKFIKKQLIDKNGAICGICGQPITDMKDCTIDHIIPKSRGGMTTLENCQLAHFRCNSKKGDQCDDALLRAERDDTDKNA